MVGDENAVLANGAVAEGKAGSSNPILSSSSSGGVGGGVVGGGGGITTTTQMEQQQVEEEAVSQLVTPGMASFTVLSRPHKPQDVGELRRVCATKRGFVEVHGQRVLPGNAAAVAEQVRKDKRQE